jgi:hypothetical protein
VVQATSAHTWSNCYKKQIAKLSILDNRSNGFRDAIIDADAVMAILFIFKIYCVSARLNFENTRGWQPKRAALSTIIQDAWAWEQK